MSNIIEELFYGNLEPQELTTEITPKLKKKFLFAVYILHRFYTDILTDFT